MKAFEASEIGIKPGMAIVTDETQGRMMDLFRQFSAQPRCGSPVTGQASAIQRTDNIIASDKLSP